MGLEEVFQKETKTEKSTETIRDIHEYYKRYSEWLEVVIKQLREGVYENVEKSIEKIDGCVEENNIWAPFYFEGNQAWGWIDSPEEWKRIVKAYKDICIDLLTAKRNPNNERDAFGFYHEYNGHDNLGEFAKTNKMDLCVHKEHCMININGICSCV